MNSKTIMVVAGDPSGDEIAAGLVGALKETTPEATFIGAGGPAMARAGVANSFDLTGDSVIGFTDILKKLPRFLRYKRQLTQLALEAKPELIVHVDFSGFNRRLAQAIRRRAPAGWRPKIVQYVSPQVWASRPGRASAMARDFDLLLCLFPFEKDWYARHVPEFRVEFVGHPIFDRYPAPVRKPGGEATVVLLPGSRRAELKRHLPVMLEAARLIKARQAARFRMVVPNEEMAVLARETGAGERPEIEIQTGRLEEALSQGTVALACTGTVTLECAWFGVPAVAMYKTSLWTYWIARKLITVEYLSLPNLLANKALYPEYIQGMATADNIAGAALELLGNPGRRAEIQKELARIMATLGGPGAARRAAAAILSH